MGTGKVYNEMQNVGRVRYVVNYHDGEKTHTDGSPFFDIATFSNNRKRDSFLNQLKGKGYNPAGTAPAPKPTKATPATAAAATPADARKANLMPGGVPRWVRCYDNGGPDAEGGSLDRYTVVYTGHYPKGERPYRSYQYVAMNEAPFHPQGIGQHGESSDGPIDVRSGWVPAIGRKNHLGTRIAFKDLPKDCKRLVIQDYRGIWGLNKPVTGNPN